MSTEPPAASAARRWPSFITTRSDIASCRFGHAWRDRDGEPRALVELGGADIFFRSPADADSVIAAATEAKEALERMEANPGLNEVIPGAQD